jgi:hypothetical protein
VVKAMNPRQAFNGRRLLSEIIVLSPLAMIPAARREIFEYSRIKFFDCYCDGSLIIHNDEKLMMETIS